MKKLLTTIMLLAFAIGMKAQNDAPQLEYVVELKVKCEGAYQVGQTSHGNRSVIPIEGGTFEGPHMKGILNSISALRPNSRRPKTANMHG